MINEILIFAGSGITIIWGVAHLFPTKSVVKNFGDISADNKNIITMEWIVEGMSLILTGVIVAGTTILSITSPVSSFVYILSTAYLLAMALISLFTGFKVNFIAFKLCPLFFTLSAGLILLGYIL